MISIIAAVAKNRAIGHNNKLIYWLPNDLKRFKALTTGHTIIMGRNTYESLPKGALPNRRNVVLSTSVKELPGCYRQAMPLADRLCLTEVDDTPAHADAFFPDYSAWRVVNKEAHPKDERHTFEYAFVDYERHNRRMK